MEFWAKKSDLVSRLIPLPLGEVKTALLFWVRESQKLSSTLTLTLSQRERELAPPTEKGGQNIIYMCKIIPINLCLSQTRLPMITLQTPHL